MAMTQKWLFTFGAHEMLNVPMLAECGDHTLFDWTSACTANRYAHLIMATQTVQLVNVVSSKAWTTFHLTSGRIQLSIARCTIEMIAMIDFVPES